MDVDELETLVKESLESKKVCENRISQVKKSIDDLLKESETEGMDQ